jgi:hypothetical protein
MCFAALLTKEIQASLCPMLRWRIYGFRARAGPGLLGVDPHPEQRKQKAISAPKGQHDKRAIALCQRMRRCDDGPLTR